MNANENVLFENLQKEIDDIAEEQKHILFTHIKKLFNLKMLEYQKVLLDNKSKNIVDTNLQKNKLMINIQI